MAQGLSPVAPLKLDVVDGIALNKSYFQLVRQNLKMLLLTSPGERIMEADFGVGMRRVLFEADHPTTYATVSARIYKQCAQFLPYLEIKELEFFSQGTGYPDMPDNTVRVKIVFNIKPLNRQGELEVEVS
jgi:phage baseplate assembly protein W